MNHRKRKTLGQRTEKEIPWGNKTEKERLKKQPDGKVSGFKIDEGFETTDRNERLWDDERKHHNRETSDYMPVREPTTRETLDRQYQPEQTTWETKN